jgi:phenylpropionate dioxygenase-like ring-hydroxylating dioxygenase large terminal subunit
MPTSQMNAKVLNPNSLNLVQVAVYDRLIDAPLNRAWENVLDWAHLPYLHETTFDYAELQDAGDWGWRTWSNASHTDHIELTVSDTDSYVARSYQSGQQVSEIWTTLTAHGDQTKVHVEFHFPDVDTEIVDTMGAAILSLYTRLWDEDEQMMRQRHTRLLEKRAEESEANLGSEADVLQHLKAGGRLLFQIQKREYQLREVDGALIAHSSICPHRLGPLADADISTGKLRCPWHGYEFDLQSGNCISPKDADCHLAPAPELCRVSGNIIARL